MLQNGNENKIAFFFSPFSYFSLSGQYSFYSAIAKIEYFQGTKWVFCP